MSNLDENIQDILTDLVTNTRDLEENRNIEGGRRIEEAIAQIKQAFKDEEKPKIEIYISEAPSPDAVKPLFVRMLLTDGSFNKYTAITDVDNRASQLQMFKSLIEMIKGICTAQVESSKKASGIV
jgi:hypothetical protein